jgi:hypothetical protein
MQAPVARGTLKWAAFLGCLAAVLGALAFAVGASAFGPWRWALAALLGWASLSLAVTLSLYAVSAFGGAPGPVMSGARWPALQPLVWPFRGVATALWALLRRVRGGGPAVRVTARLYVGPKPFGGEAAALRAEGITAICDMTAELPETARFGVAPFVRLRVPTLDRAHSNDDELARAVNWVLARRAEGRGVLVHCAFGRGRSAMVVAATLLALDEAASVDEAVAMLTRVRPLTRLRTAQLQGLERFLRRTRSR